MKSTPDINTVGVHWGVTSTGLTGFGSLVLNGTDQTLEADQEMASDASGYVVSHVTYNHKESATLETWVSGSANASNATIAASTVPEPGSKLTITDSVATVLSGSNWIVGSSAVKRVNNSFARITTNLVRFAKIS